jgi:hypothetical protein
MARAKTRKTIRMTGKHVALQDSSKHSTRRFSALWFPRAAKEDAMKRLAFRIWLFVIVWYEVAAEFRIGADMAFVVTLALLGGLWVARVLVAQSASLFGPVTSGLVLLLVLWFVLFWWLAPAAFQLVPFVFDVLIFVALVLAGARCRFLVDEYRANGGKIVPAEHSELVLAVTFGTLTLCMFAMNHWGTLWPLVGLALLPALPIAFGWRMGPVAAAARSDARMGDRDAFRDAGLSDEL